MLILDEMDHILTTRFVSEEQAMGAIKHITNVGNVSVICVGTHEIERLRKLDSQHFRRHPPTILERFVECDFGFYDLLASIEEQIKPKDPIGFILLRDSMEVCDDNQTQVKSLNPNEEKLLGSAKQLADTLHRGTYGLLGYLTPVLQEAYSLLNVFELDFDENTQDLNLKKVLKEAYQNIIGDVSEQELSKMITN